VVYTYHAVHTVLANETLKHYLTTTPTTTITMTITTPKYQQQVTEALSKVQLQAESYFASIRRTVFEFDEVLNSQRVSLYRTREAILAAAPADTEALVLRYAAETIAEIVPNFAKSAASGTVDAAGLATKLQQFFPTAPAGALDADLFADKSKSSESALKEVAQGGAAAAWAAKRDELDKVTVIHCASISTLALSIYTKCRTKLL
jgi:preprotein translocase subunit SecA